MISEDRLFTFNKYFSISKYNNNNKTTLIGLEDKKGKNQKFIEHCNKKWEKHINNQNFYAYMKLCVLILKY